MAIVIVRTLLVYITLLLALRLLGKRQLGEMELSEFVVAALIADMAAHPLQDIGIPLLNGLLPVAVLFCCEVLISGLALKNIRLRGIIFGKPSILICRGVIQQKEMTKNRFTCDELLQQLRNQGSTDISKIEYAILETDGKLNVIPFPAERPLTASQLQLPTGPGGFPVVIIEDGRVLGNNLQTMGKTRTWLQQQLNEQGVRAADEVFLMTLDQSDQIFFCRKEERR